MAGAIDEDTMETLASGRQTVWSMLSAAQTHLKKVFLVFVIGMMLTIWALRAFVWDKLKRDLVTSRMNVDTAEATEIVVVTPFDVILLQVKIGLFVGILVALPVLVWLSRDSLKQRGYWPDGTVPRWKIYGVGISIAVLFVFGVGYAYFLFFPIMFNFLAENAVQSGFKPTWSIVMWTEFIFFLALSFGLAAQLPLAMSAAARSGVVPYETFRDKWRYAVVAIFVFGAMFSPPDPFTQVMWGVPLVALYGISLAITKLAVLSQRAGQQASTREVARRRWNQIAGVFVLATAGVYAYLLEGGIPATNDLLESAGSKYRVVIEGSDLGVFGLPPAVVATLIGALVALLLTGLVLFYFRIKELEKRTHTRQERARTAAEPSGTTEGDGEPSKTPAAGEPAAIDIGQMSTPAIKAASTDAFAELSEQRALQYAEEAMEADNPEKAKAILDRFDEAQEQVETTQTDQQAQEDEENVVTSTAAGILDPFTEDETTEDDIGGYYYDVRFILDSLTSKAVWIVATFMVVMAGTFMFLYTGGIGRVKNVFFRQMPEAVIEEPEIVVLHPVEALIFMLKFSMLLGGLSILPLLLYFAWPAVEERGISTGDRSVLLVWGGTMFVAIVGGTLLGFLYIAPTLLSLLANDVVSSDMVIAYRISSFGWLVIYLTVGVGLLTMIPVTMVLFHHGDIVPYRLMRENWRTVVLGFFAAAGFLSPKGIFTMFLVAIPAGFAYGVGLGLLWIYALVGSSTPKPRGETAD